MVNSWSPSSRLSSTPVAVMICGVSQLSVVKVIFAGATAASSAAELATSTTTLPPGGDFSESPKVAVPRASVVSALSMPATSSYSRICSSKSGMAMSAKGAPLKAALMRMVSLLSGMASAVGVIITGAALADWVFAGSVMAPGVNAVKSVVSEAVPSALTLSVMTASFSRRTSPLKVAVKVTACAPPASTRNSGLAVMAIIASSSSAFSPETVAVLPSYLSSSVALSSTARVMV